MITRETYSVKHIANGVGRIYIKNSKILRQNGYVAGAQFSITERKHALKLTLCNDGTKSVNKTNRGELVEIRSKMVGAVLNGVSKVNVTFKQGIIYIEVALVELKRMIREAALIKSLLNEIPLRFASIFSGIGTLSYQIKKGLQSQLIESEIALSIDSDTLAMNIQIEGNPIWNTPTEDAQAYGVDIRDIDVDQLKSVHVAEVGYPCVGQSTLCPASRRDLDHPEAGTLFIPLIGIIKKLNPALIILENSVPFIKSQTLSLMEREFDFLGYRLQTTKINGYDNGDFEERRRACAVLISKGLPELPLDQFYPPSDIERSTFNSIRDDIADNSDKWSLMEHVTKKSNDTRLNFKHNLLIGDEDKVATLTAGYASPRIGSPMVAHDNYEENGLQRLISNLEHSRIRGIPDQLWRVLEKVGAGNHSLVSKRGNTSHVHRMLGNGVSPKAWFNLSAFIGGYLRNLAYKESLMSKFR
ncbi:MULTISPECIES: DNA cytosine methyltransferase [Vibrio]|uniref:Uncharacterized protein n=1 Tax=Vibrio tasmaniensis TaxID=212663 RepID=A0A2N7NCR8_9VIBR|nr:DNA cytosine methyltransferase [Vibrio tasmaniensis]PMO89831.1 hypothetical protein BCT01_00685 [Vibrio tasmaniensis]PMP09996.1 hypothetical protein BCS92_02405 [Vibrio tasmaniensis]TKG32619.1 hypothetical protein FC057_12445 [Vibrio tasmaniensis]TKG41697.1 hypothetical protein FC063_07495 [Vibrio tasmaniensis]TKG52052.1 hypothetical protein FC070_09765 [Vibrio tasmaniensis]